MTSSAARRAAGTALAAAALSVGAVGTVSTASAAPAATPKTLSDTLKVKQALELKLADCSDCGYRWAVVGHLGGAVTIGKITTTPAQLAPGEVGGIGSQTFHFTGKKLGKETILLGYYAPGVAKPTRTLTLTLRVTK